MQQNFLDSSESPEQAETLSELLRIGKDEMNLAEFPLTLLSDRASPDETSLKFEDQIFDDRKGKLITRKRLIEGSKEYGLPTATDDAVILALIQLTKLKNGFTARELEFTRHELISMLSWPNKGQSYERIALSLHRVASVTYHFENSWWDNRRKAWTTKIFGIIDTVELNDSRESGGQNGLFPSRIIWNQIIFDSFQAGYLRSLDFQLAISFKHAISMRIYRFMGKRFHLKPEWSFELKDFAYEHIGLSRNYEGGTQIARKLKPAIEELEAVGFLEPLSDKARFTKKGRDWSIRLTQKAVATVVPALPALPPEAPQAEAEPPLVIALAHRGVTHATAVELVAQYPAEMIARQVESFDWLAEKQDKKIAKNPAGYLVTAIQKDYAAPKGFTSRAEREKRAEAARRREQQEAEARRRQQLETAQARAEDERIAAYWDTLSKAEQKQVEADALQQADPESRQSYQSLEHRELKRVLLRNLVNQHIRNQLQAKGTLSTELA